MKVKLLKNIKYGGTLARVGEEITIKAEDLKELVSAGIVKEQPEEPEEDEVTEELEVEDITKKEIITKLTAAGIEHNPKDKKEELFNLLNGG